jgi:two-component system sensor histidine kinase KdpD
MGTTTTVNPRRATRWALPFKRDKPDKLKSTLSSYAQAVGIVVLFTVVIHLLAEYFLPANLIMVYLIGVVLAAVRFERGPAVLAALLSVSAFDFFFVPPLFQVSLFDTQYALTYTVMVIVAATISALMERSRAQAAAAIERERRTASLYALSRVFASEHQMSQILRSAAEHFEKVFESSVVILLPGAQGKLAVASVSDSGTPVFDLQQAEEAYAAAVRAEPGPGGDPARAAGPQAKPGDKALYLPLLSARGVLGIIGVTRAGGAPPFSTEQLALLETFANQTALALERAHFGEEADRAKVEFETERTRNLLLSAISHDLRTPLASITGAVSSLLENENTLGTETRHELTQVAYEEADRLNQLLSNVLEITRLQSGGLQVHKEWQPVEEVVGMALAHTAGRLRDRPLSVDIPLDLAPVPIDGLLIEQVLVNLLDNAAKHTPPRTPISLTARELPDDLLIEVADRGPGLAPGDEKRVFERFYQAGRVTAGGVGLGLAIAAGMVQAHGGRLWAENRPDGGAVFRFTLPRMSIDPDSLNGPTMEDSNPNA